MDKRPRNRAAVTGQAANSRLTIPPPEFPYNVFQRVDLAPLDLPKGYFDIADLVFRERLVVVYVGVFLIHPLPHFTPPGTPPG
jgi:hypothetical protein